MTSTKEKALEKLNAELQTAHSAAEDKIHNWICDQEDEDLFDGILKEGKSFKNAFTYLINKASEKKTGNAAVMTDQEAYEHIVHYFKNDVKVVKIDKNIQAKVVTSEKQVTKQEPVAKVETKVEKSKKAKVDMSMSIFDFIDDPNVTAEESEPDEDEDLGTDE